MSEDRYLATTVVAVMLTIVWFGELLAELGYGETVDAYLEMTRWFA